MEEDPPKPNIGDMAQLLRGESVFATNGFAPLNVPHQRNEDDNNSDGGDSLFGDSGPDNIKHEEVEPGSFSQPGPEMTSAELSGPGSSNTVAEHPNTSSIASMSMNPLTSDPQAQLHNNNNTDVADSDDDLMIVDVAELPAHVKNKFSSTPRRWSLDTPDLEFVGIRIKPEPQSSRVVIDLDQVSPAPAIKQEPRRNNESLFDDDDIFIVDREADRGPGTAVAAGAQDDDEAMFVGEELHRPASASTPCALASSTSAPEPPGQSAATEPAGPVVVDEGPGPADPIDPDHPDDPDGGNGGDEENGIGADGDGAEVGDDGGIEVVDDDDADDEFTIGDDQELSDGEQPRARRRKPNRKKKPTASASSSVTLDGDQNNGGDQGANDAVELDKEDLEDELKLLEVQFEVYNKRKEKGKLRPHDNEGINEVTRKIEDLKQRISKSQPSAEQLAEEGLRELLEQEDSGDEDGQAGRVRQKKPASRIPAIARSRGNLPPAPTAQKRKSNPSAAASDHRSKRQKGSTKARVARARLSKTTETLLNMVRSNDPIAARAQMDDLQVFTDFKANTLKEQFQKLKDQINADPAADQKRINAELKRITISRKAFGNKHCKPKDGKWLIVGMKKELHHYQLVGAGWMLQRELQQKDPFYGGILADSVGLGKTIEAIACIIGNPLHEDDRAEGRLGTLVVVPSNLVAQWQDEIDACCSDLTVVHYHSAKSNRVRMSNIRRADIVVTTYHEVAKAYPNIDRLKKLENTENDLEVTKKFSDALGELFTVEWHRVILDEAHAIKNGATHTSKACIQLRSKYRWALTATPLHNGLHEILPYMQFVGAVEADPIANPNDRRSARPQVSTEQIDKFLEEAMMVRQFHNLFLGKALFELPNTHPLPNIWISLSEEEFLIYRRIENIIRRHINNAQALPSKKRQTATFFSLAVRLRQAVSHPFTLFNLMRDIYGPEDIKDIRTQMREIKRKNPNRRFVEQVGCWFETKLTNGRIEAQVLKSDIPDQFGKGDHGYEFNMDPQLAKMEKLKSGPGSICNICNEPCTAPRTTKCKHKFCRDCIESLIETEKEEGSDRINCPTCNREYPINRLMAGQKKKRAYDPQMPGNDWKGLQPLGDEESAEFLTESDKNDQLAMAPSAKTVMVKDIILKWQKEAPDDKIIVFTQWVVVGRVLGRMLQQEKIEFVYYFGEMTREEKEDNVKAFHAAGEVKVMLASLKCGGQGLNLTCANRVILVDPWWNSALEFQGYGRVFRMGQKKETWFVRLLARKTIDGRMAKLQAKKLSEINSAIKDFDYTRSTLNFEEVAELFGRVRRDENGKMIGVESDYDTDDEEGDDGGEANGIQPPGGGDGAREGGVFGPVGDFDQEANGVYGDGGFSYGNSVVNGYGIQDL